MLSNWNTLLTKYKELMKVSKKVMTTAQRYNLTRRLLLNNCATLELDSSTPI